ncbi:hypothetical protein PVT67_10770 [Gallaecimonas kandeliae]|uniref:hypothetical protein n=1 Tax=Gallaecimonas kandeliae TaxID=3029055 RepID=UPI0026494D4A|nr:hypothetical protein [Gallaecimonas kandeliae]WKE64177.1 hypothetical protein PVT67_10770 [Gallaecimonas kandeliae]
MSWLLLPFLSPVFALLFYVEAWKGGIRPNHWALVGFFAGPLAWPMLQASKRLWWRKVCGFSGVLFPA